MSTTDLLTNVNRRALQKTKLLHIAKVIEGNEENPLNIAQLRAFQSSLSKIEATLDVIQDNVSIHCKDDAELLAQTEATSTVYGLLTSCQQSVLGLLEKIQTHTTSSSASSPEREIISQGQGHTEGRPLINVRLPKLDLPTFEGNYHEWIPFRDQFTASIITNQRLSGCERLQYLKASLKGEALKLISAFPITNDNFQSCWDLIETRYNNKRELIYAILKRFYSQPKVSSENGAQLRRLVDESNECLSLLRTLGRSVDDWDDLLVYHIVDKLDQETKREWSKKLHGTDPPTLLELFSFLEDHIRGLMSIHTKHDRLRDQRKAHTISHQKCILCSESHSLFKCSTFHGMSIPERINCVKAARVCFNCLGTGHGVKACISKGSCRECGLKHNTLLHLKDRSVQSQALVSESQVPSVPSVDVQNHHTSGVGILLATAIVLVKDNFGSYVKARAFLDPGSESSFITEKFLQRIGLPRSQCNINISGVGSSSIARVKGRVIINVKSFVSSFQLNLDALVLPKVTGNLPSFNMNGTWKDWGHIKHIQLADHEFHSPREVDILIGADATARIFTGQRLLGPLEQPVACSSEFGWILQGPVGVGVHQTQLNSFHSVKVHQEPRNTDLLLQRFWELEQVPETQHRSQEETDAEKHFIINHSRQQDGRYVVPLPYNSKLQSLGNSKQIALKRFLSTEKRLERNPSWMSQYKGFIHQYLELGHMEEVPHEEMCQDENPKVTNYLPHHFVTKIDSTTTKFRVVFDGSCKSSTGISLNDCLLVGPTIQADIFTHLLRFRYFLVALKADIAKMYRQFLVSFQDSDRQRILWRESRDDSIKEYRLKTVTYGTASAPFSATRALMQLAVDEGESFPLAARAIRKNFYVDDLLGGGFTVHQAVELQQQLTGLLSKAQLELRKWDSSHAEVLNQIDSNIVESAHSLSLPTEFSSKALGVHWDSIEDKLFFKNFEFSRTPLTRRNILSEMAQIFDPLGLVSPVTINVKIFFQLLWRHVKEDGTILNWDDELPQNLHSHWENYKKAIGKISSIQIPRCITLEGVDCWELHTFSDASEKAYSAVTYLRSLQGNQPKCVRLISAKAKVAPLSAKSIPRLELCGAHLASKLSQSISDSLEIEAIIHFWTDSEIVLHWISSPSRKWNVFVSNRVAAIQESTQGSNWHFVSGTQNPADCASRGIDMEDLIDFTLWWRGPEFLMSPGLPSFQYNVPVDRTQLEEKKVMHNQIKQKVTSLLYSYSSLSRLQRVIGWIYRFAYNTQTKNSSKERSISPLTANELHRALLKIVKLSQEEDFQNEITSLTQGHPVSRKSSLLSLNPILIDGVICVGGRLHKSLLPNATKHQLIISGKSYLAKLIVVEMHLRLLHGGPRLVTSTLLRRFWITRGQSTIKKHIRACVKCRKARGRTMDQLMGTLPEPRVTPSSPFMHTGVDYAGPFNLSAVSGRGRRGFKGYFCVFICLAVKAVHLEPVTSLSTESFINTLRRFIARRGKPAVLYSDCGRNFVGAAPELQQFFGTSSNKSRLCQFSASEGIDWRFNPPSAPHQGGLWEAAVKSAKTHIKKVIGDSILTLEEFSTLLAQVEAILNSRPITPLSSDVDDLDVLTPGHFLIGKPLIEVPNIDLLSTPSNRLSHWNKQQQMYQHFWQRWSREYLTTLQERVKWKRPSNQVQVGDLVSIKDDFIPPLKWRLGRVISIHPGGDGITRVVTLKTSNGELKRPITKLVSILPQESTTK